MAGDVDLEHVLQVLGGHVAIEAVLLADLFEQANDVVVARKADDDVSVVFDQTAQRRGVSGRLEEVVVAAAIAKTGIAQAFPQDIGEIGVQDARFAIAERTSPMEESTCNVNQRASQLRAEGLFRRRLGPWIGGAWKGAVNFEVLRQEVERAADRGPPHFDGLFVVFLRGGARAAERPARLVDPSPDWQ